MVHQMIQARPRLEAGKRKAAYRSARREPADLRSHRPLPRSRCGNAARSREIRVAKTRCVRNGTARSSYRTGSLGICREPRTGRKAAICPRDPFEPRGAGGLDEQPTAPRGQPSQKTPEMQGIQIKKRSKPTNKNGSGRKEQKEGQASHHTSDKAVLKPFGLLWLNVML